MFVMLYVCWCICIRILCSSSVGSNGIRESVSAVVLVKGMFLCISVMRPPPPRIGRSCRSVVYPGNFGVVLSLWSLVSWIVAMCMFCSCRSVFSCMCLFWMPLMLSCKMLSVLLGEGGRLRGTGLG